MRYHFNNVWSPSAVRCSSSPGIPWTEMPQTMEKVIVRSGNTSCNVQTRQKTTSRGTTEKVEMCRRTT